MTRVVWPKEDCTKNGRQQTDVLKSIQVLVELDVFAAHVWMKHSISWMLVVAANGFGANVVVFSTRDDRHVPCGTIVDRPRLIHATLCLASFYRHCDEGAC